MRNLTITGAGSTGIYLEAGSRNNLVQDNVVRTTASARTGRADSSSTSAATTFRFWGIGREGLAIDGSYDNRVVGNSFAGNSAGGIFLYTNCGEFVNQRPERWFQRRFGANDNVIEGNEFTGGINGVWVGSRMGENTFPMDCSDPKYVTGPLLAVALDRAADNTVRNNVFNDVTYGVRVEDDGTKVVHNQFNGPTRPSTRSWSAPASAPTRWPTRSPTRRSRATSSRSSATTSRTGGSTASRA